MKQTASRCEFCEQSADLLERIEVLRDDGELRPYQLCEGCIDELEYVPTADDRLTTPPSQP